MLGGGAGRRPDGVGILHVKIALVLANSLFQMLYDNQIFIKIYSVNFKDDCLKLSNMADANCISILIEKFVPK